MKVGDLIAYKKSRYISDRVHNQYVGIVLEFSPLHGPDNHRNVRVRWNTVHSSVMWHEEDKLEVISEGRRSSDIQAS